MNSPPPLKNSATRNSPNPEPATIRATREAAGLSQTAASALVHSSLRTWQQWEAGDRRMHAGLWELFRLKTALSERTPKKPSRRPISRRPET